MHSKSAQVGTPSKTKPNALRLDVLLLEVILMNAIPLSYIITSTYVKIMYNSKEHYSDLPLLPAKIELETKKVLRQACATTGILAALLGAPRFEVVLHRFYWFNKLALQLFQLFLIQLCNPKQKHQYDFYRCLERR